MAGKTGLKYLVLRAEFSSLQGVADTAMIVINPGTAHTLVSSTTSVSNAVTGNTLGLDIFYI